MKQAAWKTQSNIQMYENYRCIHSSPPTPTPELSVGKSLTTGPQNTEAANTSERHLRGHIDPVPKGRNPQRLLHANSFSARARNRRVASFHLPSSDLGRCTRSRAGVGPAPHQTEKPQGPPRPGVQTAPLARCVKRPLIRARCIMVF